MIQKRLLSAIIYLPETGANICNIIAQNIKIVNLPARNINIIEQKGIWDYNLINNAKTISEENDNSFNSSREFSGRVFVGTINDIITGLTEYNK